MILKLVENTTLFLNFADSGNIFACVYLIILKFSQKKIFFNLVQLCCFYEDVDAIWLIALNFQAIHSWLLKTAPSIHMVKLRLLISSHHRGTKNDKTRENLRAVLTLSASARHLRECIFIFIRCVASHDYLRVEKSPLLTYQQRWSPADAHQHNDKREREMNEESLALCSHEDTYMQGAQMH